MKTTVNDGVIRVLTGLRHMHVQDCWCDASGDSPHMNACDAARALWDRLQLPATNLNDQLSACCNAPTFTANTDYHVCSSCREACDTANPRIAQPVNPSN